MSLPLILRGTPDVEAYSLSVFSTVAFARNLVAGIDPWFVSGYGFGIPLPSSTWFIKFPPAILAAFGGIDMVYAAVWIGGQFVFGIYLLKLVASITPHRGIAVFVLLTGLLSFSNLGTTYVDDWPENFLGWALFPVSLWYVLRTLLADSPRERVRRTAACGLVLGVFVGSAHHNEIVTFFSGMALVLAVLAWSRPRGVFAVGVASCIALASGMDVLLPAAQGMLAGGANPLVERIKVFPDDLSLASYGIFLEPGRAILADGVTAAFTSSYKRVPFFGLVALLLAVIGAVRLIRVRAPTLGLPEDVSRAIGLGFIVYSILTLLPSWVVLGLPRMWMYRDGQTVFALLCAAAALDRMRERHPNVLPLAMGLQIAQIAIVAAPLVIRVFGAGSAPLFAYARHEPAMFDGLRRVGVDDTSRVMLAGRIEDLIRGQMPEAGVTAGTDFPIEGIALVNGWYRGAESAVSGPLSQSRRYGKYETYISWNEGNNMAGLKHLTAPALDVLGITHVLMLQGDEETNTWASSHGLRRVTTLDVPRAASLPLRVDVFRNDDAWPRVVLLQGKGGFQAPPLRQDCPDASVFCRDYERLSQSLKSPLKAVWEGASAEIALPPDHPGGRLFLSVSPGPDATATVDGQPRVVQPFMDAFGTIEIQPEDRFVRISITRRTSMMLTLFGVAILAGCLVVARANRRDE